MLIDFDPAKAIVRKEKSKDTPLDDEFSLKPTSLRIIQGTWSSPPESFMTGLVAIEADGTIDGCDELPVDAVDWTVVVAEEQGGEFVVQTGAPLESVYNTVVCDGWCSGLAGPDYNSCRLDCGNDLTSTCYYSGAFKLVLPDRNPYNVTASWDGLSDVAEGVGYNSAVLLLLE